MKYNIKKREEMRKDTTLNEHEKLISKKATFHKYSDVHVTLNNGWENGNIVEVGADFFILKLNEEGKKKNGDKEDKVIFFLETEDINELRSER